MTDHVEKQCPKCGQQLRFPKHVGGMVMACPSCGKKFYSDFKFGGTKRNPRGSIFKVYELPNNILKRLFRFLS